jgi:ketosteroid isomerase-like protein
MKNHLFLALLLISGRVLAQTATQRDVLAAENARFAAQVRQDFPTLERLIGDDLFYVHSNGDIDTKATFIGGMREGRRRYDAIRIDTAAVRVFGKTAVINATCTYYRKNPDGTPNNLYLRYTDVWVRRRGGWQLVSWQSQRRTP